MMKAAATSIKTLVVLAAWLLCTAAKAQTWNKLQIDSFVAAEVPYPNESPQPGVFYLSRNDSCAILIQVNHAETDLSRQEVSKSVTDSYTGMGYEKISEKTFIVDGQELVELVFANERDNTNSLRDTRYIRAFSVMKKLYMFSFIVYSGMDQAMSGKRERFFSSLSIRVPEKKNGAADLKGKAKGIDYLYYLLGFVLVFALIILPFIIARKRKKRS